MRNTTIRTIVAAMSVLSLPNMACFRDDSPEARAAAESAGRQIRLQSSVADVVEIAAAQDRPFEVTGVCGENGALNVRRVVGQTGSRRGGARRATAPVPSASINST